MERVVAHWSLDPGNGVYGKYTVIDRGDCLYEIYLEIDGKPNRPIGTFRVVGGKVIWWRCEVPKEFCGILTDFIRNGNLKS